MSDFSQQLRRVRLLLGTGRAAAAVLALAAVAGLLWLIFGLADWAAGFETGGRKAITLSLLALTGAAGLTALIRALTVGSAEAAAKADAALADPREPAAAALSLDPAAAATPLAEMLTRRSLEAASASLKQLPLGKIFPWRLIGRAMVALAIPVIAIAIFRSSAPAAFSTVSQRLLHPDTDIPPYSPLVFRIDPTQPSAVYGGDLQLVAEITGGTIDHPVECLIRRSRSGEVLRLPAFRESPTRFSRRLDGLTESMDIATACGKARSHWVPVEILLEPKILSGVVRTTPPAYTGLAARSFPLDTNEIAAIEGSTVSLELTSNRPLASGKLIFTPAAAPGVEAVPRTIEGTISSSHQATFTWTATLAGRISATVSDLRGTPAPQPLDLALRILPDRAPVVELTSPPHQLLATPKSVIPIAGTAEDDFSLSRLQFVRTLSGFRDRVRVVAPDLHDRNYAFNDKLDLYDLGLEAGQVIELMLEASDRNPSLLGHGSSGISRIKIISEDQYAEYIRAKTTIAQFGARFEAARESMENARESLEKLGDALEKGDAEGAAKALEEARDAQRAGADLLEKIAGDFPAFELEKRLAELAEKQAADLRENLDALEKIDPAGGEGQQAAIDEMLERLGRRQEQAEQLDEDVALARDAARILEMAAKFRQIYENQVSVAKRFGSIVKELRQGDNQNRRLLPSLAGTQEKNRAALGDFKTELKLRLDSVKGGEPMLAPLVDSAFQFLADLDAAAPETLMDAAATHGKAGQANDAYTNAELARELLERLLSKPEPFPEAVMGKAPALDLPRPDVNANIEQMLKALLGQNPGDAGGGQAPAGELGMGGTGPQGAPTSGIPMDLPVVGPERLEFEPLASSSKSGDGKSKTGPVAPLPETAEAGKIHPTETRRGESSTLSPESIPEPYREAVKRFFTP
ncbi:MAG: hypothetical protein ABIS50_07900 [Luteolibacter sp.]|uniref:hypothetical protein n=1 Tax=Luteolibacter sp. TaxID=1962973 RepID=UPI00326524DF